MMFDLFLKIFIIVPMFFWWPNMQTYAPQECVVQYTAMTIFGVSFLEVARREIKNKTLWLLFAYLSLNTFILHFSVESRMALMNLFLGLLAYKLIAERWDFNFRKIGAMLAVFLVANYLLIVLQHFNKDPINSMLFAQNKPQMDQVGFMGIAYALGLLGAFSIPFLYSLNPWVCLLVIPAFYFGKSSTAVGAGLMAFLYLFIPETINRIKISKYRNLLIGLSTSAALILTASSIYYVFFMDMPTGQFSKRFAVWMAGIALWKDQALFGHGLGTWASKGFVGIQTNGKPESWLWAHNEFIQFLFETGLVGMCFLYAYFKDLLRNFDFRHRNGRILFSAFIVLMVACFFHFPFHVGKFAAISLFILAGMEAHKNETIKRRLNRPWSDVFNQSRDRACVAV